MKVCLVTPPFTQLNTPYPAIGMLGQVCRRLGHDTHFRDLSIELALELYSSKGMSALFEALEDVLQTDEAPEAAWEMYAYTDRLKSLVPALVGYLQNQDLTLAHRIVNTDWLPPTPRLKHARIDSFGRLGIVDAARYLATLLLEDIADLAQLCLDEGFAFSRYQSHLATGPSHFDPIVKRIHSQSVFDDWLEKLCNDIEADVAIISIPFPGTLYGALRIGKHLKSRGIEVWMGGGYVSTELRTLDEDAFWDYCDALVYDDGEGPLEALFEWKSKSIDRRHRTRTRHGLHQYDAPRTPFEPIPWYGDLNWSLYLQVLDSLNPTHRLWSDGRWNKMIVAHGCYWKKCAFCDIQLDYIADYVPSDTQQLIDGMATTVQETGRSGFHFVDEAAPPKALKQLALGLRAKNLSVSWWGNIRFESAYTTDTCRLLAAQGLIAVTGGLEVASDRLLKLMNKGVTIESAARTALAFQEAGVMVHAYLMYGFPSQTVQETIDSMEIVRQMFEAGLLSSAFWHRFVLTRHSGIYAQPEPYQIEIPDLPEGIFASNDMEHHDPDGGNHDLFDDALPNALRAWMEGNELDRPVQTWFDAPMPGTTEDPKRIQRAISGGPATPKNQARVIWLGPRPIETEDGLMLFNSNGQRLIRANANEIEWILKACDPTLTERYPLFHHFLQSCPSSEKRFWKLWSQLNGAGLVAI
ncbi:MAG: B12-binding domain-containing radical SAM protein [Myxococcota bacterium]